MAESRSSYTFERVEDYLIADATKLQIQSFLASYFDADQGNVSGLKQLPTFRVLVRDGESLIGHLAVQYRNVFFDRTYKTFCLTEFCVHPDYRNQKLGQLMLAKIERLATRSSVPFLIAISDHISFYEQNGFQNLSRNCKWLLTQQQTIGVINRKLNGGILVKSINQPIPASDLDLLGMIF